MGKFGMWPIMLAITVDKIRQSRENSPRSLVPASFLLANLLTPSCRRLRRASSLSSTPVDMPFNYRENFSTPSREAYVTLVGDVIK